MIKKLESQRAKEIYSFMEKDFKEDEIPEEEDFYAYVKDGSLILYAYEEENREKAYMVWIQKNNIVLITHLAVKEEYRSSGIGSKMIKEMEETFPQVKQWIVEAETEKEAKMEDERKNIQRRFRFYERLGFQKQETIDYVLYGVSYYLFVKSKEKIEPEELAKTMRELYGNHISENKMQIKIDK